MVFAKIKDRLGQVVANDNGTDERTAEEHGGIAFTELRLQLCWDATKKLRVQARWSNIWIFIHFSDGSPSITTKKHSPGKAL